MFDVLPASALGPHHLVISPMAQTQADPFSFLCNDTARAKRVQSYRVWELQRKLSDISSQTEAAVLEVSVIRDAAAMSCRNGALWVVWIYGARPHRFGPAGKESTVLEMRAAAPTPDLGPVRT